ncbi:MAG: hypothetical protein Q7V05_01645 [Methanoregula sp.]|nr:hypothetical protein [Methanoregula sp.]
MLLVKNNVMPDTNDAGKQIDKQSDASIPACGICDRVSAVTNGRD